MRRLFFGSVLVVLPLFLLPGCGGGGGGSSANSTPVINEISPTSGPAPGGTTVTITGLGFGNSSGGLNVKFGSANAASVTFLTSNTVQAVSPPGTGTVDVQVTTVFGSTPATSADLFTYTGDGPPPPPVSLNRR